MVVAAIVQQRGGVVSATGMRPRQRGQRGGGDQGPACTDYEIFPGGTFFSDYEDGGGIRGLRYRGTARGGQGSGCGAGDPPARPRGPPPTGQASRPSRNRRPPRSFQAAPSPAAGLLDEQTTPPGRQDSGCRDGDPAAQMRGPQPTGPGRRPSRDRASRSFHAAPLPAAGVLDMDGRPGEDRAAGTQGQGSCRPGVWQWYV